MKKMYEIVITKCRNNLHAIRGKTYLKLNQRDF